MSGVPDVQEKSVHFREGNLGVQPPLRGRAVRGMAGTAPLHVHIQHDEVSACARDPRRGRPPEQQGTLTPFPKLLSFPSPGPRGRPRPVCDDTGGADMQTPPTMHPSFLYNPLLWERVHAG